MTTNDIAGLPIAEQLMLMEKLWAAPRTQANIGVVPAWHEEYGMARKLPPIHPGEILREEFMVPFGLSSTALANILGVE